MALTCPVPEGGPRRGLGALLAACVAGLVVCGVATAQVGTATIVGQVTDASGGVLPGVSVTAVQMSTEFRFDTVTNDAGLFRIQNLQPGDYRVTFDLAGFRRLVRAPIQLSAGGTVRANGTLEVGEVTDDVEVMGKPPLLATNTSDTGTVMEGETLYELPMYQRFANSTLTLVPGATGQGYAYGGSLDQFHVAGQRNSAIAFAIDGMEGSSPVGGTTTVRATQNSLAEVKVYTGTLPAEFGHSAGGVVSVVKKTGTNDLHGMASVLWRSGPMQHRNFFDRERTADIFFMQPDGYLGGPVVLPGIYDGHAKTFFFVAFERLLDKQVVQLLGEVPSPEMKAGDFSFGGVGNQIFDPTTTRQLPDGTWTRDPFPGNVIPLDRIDPVARRILELDPWLPQNVPGSVNADGPVSNLLYDRRGRVDWNDFSTRIDHQFQPAFTIYGSYQLNESGGNPGRATNMKVEDDLQDFAGGSGRQTDTLVQIFSGGNTWVLGPTLVSGSRVGYQRRAVEDFSFSWRKNYGQILGIPNISAEMLPSFGTGDEFSPESIYGITPTGPSHEIGETYSVQTDLTHVRGAHALKMGYELLWRGYKANDTSIPSGQFSFDSMTAGLQADGNPVPNTGNTFAGFLLGDVRQAQFDGELAPWRPRSTVHSVFFQDDWNVTSSLTLNLGVRYSNESPYHAAQSSNFDPTAMDEVTGLTGAIVHPDAPLSRRDNN
ncbi:MAG: carboxypeptidase regulatory-like domain-containing protein, partial [Vicinamibacteraceae bacterium]